MRNRLKSVMKTFNNGERGMVLPIVLILLLLIGIMVPPLMSLISTSLVTGKMYETNSKELYAADAGVMDAMWLLGRLNDPHKEEEQIEADVASLFGEDGTYTYKLPEEINGKTVTVEIKIDINSYIITSTAIGTDGSTTTIETRVQDPPPPPPIWMACGALDGHLKMVAEVGLESQWIDVYANGDIYMIGSTMVYGNAYYTAGHGIAQYPSSGYFSGEGIETEPLQIAEDFIPEKPVDIIFGSLYVEEDMELGPVYILGDLLINVSVEVELKGTVWVSGKIQVNSGGVIHGMDDDGNLYWLISDWSGTGDGISVNGKTPNDADFKVKAICYAPNAPIYVGGNASIYGSAVGKELDIMGDSVLNYPLLFERVPPDYYRMECTYWKID